MCNLVIYYKSLMDNVSNFLIGVLLICAVPKIPGKVHVWTRQSVKSHMSKKPNETPLKMCQQ